MKIGLDFDGVIADSHPLKSKIAKEMFGVEIPSERFERHWIVSEILTEEQYQAVGKELYFGKHSIPPVKDALFYIDLLLQNGHSIEIVTSRTDETLTMACDLMDEYRLHLPIVGVGREISKEKACAGLDLYVDDDLKKLTPLVGKVKHLFLFSWPQNAHEQLPNRVERVESWFDLYQEIRYELS